MLNSGKPEVIAHAERLIAEAKRFGINNPEHIDEYVSNCITKNSLCPLAPSKDK